MIVLDYGCGVSDLGLVAASKGCVTICDLNDKKRLSDGVMKEIHWWQRLFQQQSN